MKMTFLNLFLIGTFKNPNFAEKLTNLSENIFKKKVELHGVHGVCYFPGLLPCVRAVPHLFFIKKSKKL